MKQEYLDLLKSLIACAPVSEDVPAVNKASALLEAFLQSHGVRVVREVIDGRNTLYASTLPAGKETDILFNAHIDVVPLSTTDQSQAVIKDGLMYGRGAGDCLGHAVVMVRLLCENPDKSIGAIFTTNEEIGGSTTREMLLRGYKASRGVVILDSYGENAIGIAEKGLLDVEITAHGVSGHAAHPWRCQNAIDILLASYQKLREAWKNPTEENNWEDSMTAVGISCSSKAHNVIPGSATMLLNIRYTKMDGVAEITEKIRKITGLDDVKVLTSCLPVFTDENNAFIQSIRVAKARVLGNEIGYFRMHGATDARHVSEVYPGLPVVMDGALMGNVHTIEEWVDLASLDQVAETYNELLK